MVPHREYKGARRADNLDHSIVRGHIINFLRISKVRYSYVVRVRNGEPFQKKEVLPI